MQAETHTQAICEGYEQIMSTNNKVVWSEGMFLRPQHFQQQDRYLERYVDGRTNAAGPYLWGFSSFQIDSELLKLGKIAVAKACGVFPDGTPFSFPDHDELPPVLQVPENTSNVMVYLCLPLRRVGALEVDTDAQQQSLARYARFDQQVRSNSSEQGEQAELQLGKLNLVLKLSSDDLSGYACIGVTRIEEYIADKAVKIDNNYVPPLLDCSQSNMISGLLTELKGLVRNRAEALSGRLVDSGRSGSAEIADYLLLQVLNRVEPLAHHMLTVNGLHPERCYTELVQIAGELSTFATASKRPPEYPRYQHDNLQDIFGSVFASLRQCLSMVLEQSAIAMDLTERKYGIYAAPITDQSLISSASFVLAVKAQMAGNQLRAQFPGQVRIAPVERIRELISAQLPGIGLQALPVAPRQIPYHSGFTYFELDRSGDLWKSLANSGGVAIHLGAEFSGISMELWAIRD
jgi:type VI secretion system protein ImpJ